MTKRLFAVLLYVVLDCAWSPLSPRARSAVLSLATFAGQDASSRTHLPLGSAAYRWQGGTSAVSGEKPFLSHPPLLGA